MYRILLIGLVATVSTAALAQGKPHIIWKSRIDDSVTRFIKYDEATNQVITGGRTIRFWNAEDGSLVRELPQRALVFDIEPKWRLLFVSDEYFDPTTEEYRPILKLLDLDSGIKLHEFVGHEYSVYAADFSPSGRLLATADEYDKTIVWNVDNYNQVAAFPINAEAVQFAPYGSSLLVAGEDAANRVADWTTGTFRQLFVWPAAYVASYSRHGGRAFLAGFGYDVTKDVADVAVVETKTGSLLRTIRVENTQTFSMAVHPRRPWIAVGYTDATLRVWNHHTGHLVKLYDEETGPRAGTHYNGVWGLFAMPDAKRLAYTTGDGDVVMAFWPHEKHPQG